MTGEWHRGEYLISTDKLRLDLDVVHGFLTSSYWAEGRPKEVVRASIENSLAFGVYRGDEQIGFARVITDYATFAYLADVFILDAHQGQGLGKFLVETLLGYPPLRSCGWTLFTKDAHGLYERYGFEPAATPERLMRRKPISLRPL